MKDLSITQEYLLCAMNDKGGFPIIGKEQPACFVAGALMELLRDEFIHLQDNKVIINRELEGSFNYLSPIFEHIKNSKPKTIKDLVSDYVISLTEKELKELIQSVGKSLVLADCACEVRKSGIFGIEKKYIVPVKEKTDYVVQKIRAELLENGVMSEETIVLVCLLSKANLLKQYFSKYELEQLNQRLKEIRNCAPNRIIKEVLDHIDTIMGAIAIAIAIVPK